jgi:methionyl-tRNA synthetase
LVYKDFGMLQFNSMKNPYFYITTTLPYVNAEPHIGFGLEIVAADVIARSMRQKGHEVIFNTGTDEHGQKIYEKALENDQTPQEYTNFWAGKFSNLKDLLNVDYTHFIRTTDEQHVTAAQKFWEIVDQNGYIYKKMYKVKYCVGCELEKQDSELVDNRCPLHPNKELELREEENYFFKFSAFQEKLLNHYEQNPEFVKPEGKFNEIKAFVQGGLKDFSISRLKEKMPWGVPVPSDPDHVMYVWFDALVNYISTLGWPNTEGAFKDFWPGVQIAGKDNLRQQSAMWQAMLLAADLQPSKQILINGFVSIDGQKMSKSLGNVIAPKEMVEKYGTDGTRFLLMFLGPIGTDMDTSWEKLDTAFTAHLSNGIGNLCSRVAKLCEKAALSGNTESIAISTEVSHQLEQMDIKEALDHILTQISDADGYLSEEQPWTKNGEEQKVILDNAIVMIKQIATNLLPFMPHTAETIITHFASEKITALRPLFPRLSK